MFRTKAKPRTCPYCGAQVYAPLGVIQKHLVEQGENRGRQCPGSNRRWPRAKLAEDGQRELL